MIIRTGNAADATAAATLHAAQITEGFLPTLGSRFLTRLYRRVAVDRSSVLAVAEEDGEVVGMAAGTEHLGRLYRTFVLKDGVLAAVVAAPRLFRSWPKLLETIRYPAAATSLPEAELLAVAVTARAHGTGVGTALTEAVLSELRGRGVPAVRVVTATTNERALRLYRRCGFLPAQTLKVHGGSQSQVLVWR